MHRRHPILITIALLCLIPFAASAQLITFTASNQSIATYGFETNLYDWMLNPLSFGQIGSSTVAFSLDGNGSQFGENVAINGFRGGYAWIREGFSPILFLDYSTTASTLAADEAGNTELSYASYDSATGRYGAITETANFTSSNLSPAQRLVSQFGGKTDGPVNFDVQLEWLLDTTTLTALSYTNTYSNTSGATLDTLTSKGSRTDTTVSLRNGSTNALALEGEVGLTFGALTSRISLGTGLMNWDFSTPSYQSLLTTYSGGLDTTVRDQETYTIYSGAYYYSSSPVASFGMNTNAANYLPYVPVALDSTTTLAFDPTFTLEIPFAFAVNFYPAATATALTRTVAYDDADADNRETARTDTGTTNTISFGRNLSSNVEGLVRKSFSSGEAVLHLGAGLKLAYTGWEATRTSAYSVHTQVDGNADADYTDAGVDTDTTYVESGYEIISSDDQIATTVCIPIAASYSPVPALTFHVGTQTSMTATCTLVSTLTTGTSTYLYETYTDNLVADNSYTQRQVDGSSSASVPSSSASWDFSFVVTGTFGATLKVADNFVIDALASTSSVGFYSFSLLGVYSF